MRRDKNAPALLELIAKGRSTEPARPVASSTRAPAVMAAPAMPTAKPELSPPPATHHAPAAAPDDTSIAGWFSPGRAVRVPTGYLVPLALLVLILVVGSYTTGYQRRKSEEIRLQSDTAAQEMAALVDPLNQPPAATPPKPQPKSPPPQAQKATNPSAPAISTKLPENRPNSTQSGRSAGVVIVKTPADDPRQSGLNYLIAATLPPDEAEKAASFLVSRGLETAVVTADNASLRWVVVLQGVAAKDLSGPAAKALEQRLQTLGREYKQVLKGPTVFNDPWWKKHTK
ncbi:MAG: hypothetical protein JNK58_06065 [Phycisphaerae bacterium]|nr:hypothetical protein [Phycisphaerae bacterium]